MLPGGTAGSALDPGWHRWLCTPPSSPVPRQHVLPRLTPRSWSQRGSWGAPLPSQPHQHSTVAAKGRAQQPLSLGTHGCCLHSHSLLLAHTDRQLLGHQLIFYADLLILFHQGSCSYLHFQKAFHTDLGYSYHLDPSMASTKKSVGLLFKRKSTTWLFCQEHILPAAIYYLFRPKKVL